MCSVYLYVFPPGCLHYNLRKPSTYVILRNSLLRHSGRITLTIKALQTKCWLENCWKPLIKRRPSQPEVRDLLKHFLVFKKFLAIFTSSGVQRKEWRRNWTKKLDNFKKSITFKKIPRVKKTKKNKNKYMWVKEKEYIRAHTHTQDGVTAASEKNTHSLLFLLNLYASRLVCVYVCVNPCFPLSKCIFLMNLYSTFVYLCVWHTCMCV